MSGASERSRRARPQRHRAGLRFDWHDGAVGTADRELAIWPCQARCSWSPTPDELGGHRLFACSACGSEWVASEAWTPVDWQGLVPDTVREERESHPA